MIHGFHHHTLPVNTRCHRSVGQGGKHRRGSEIFVSVILHKTDIRNRGVSGVGGMRVRWGMEYRGGSCIIHCPCQKQYTACFQTGTMHLSFLCRRRVMLNKNNVPVNEVRYRSDLYNYCWRECAVGECAYRLFFFLFFSHFWLRLERLSDWLCPALSYLPSLFTNSYFFPSSSLPTSLTFFPPCGRNIHVNLFHPLSEITCQKKVVGL